MPVLMSRDNPDGHKLEELLGEMISDLTIKTERLEGESSHEQAPLIIGRNRRIIDLLAQAKRLQERSMAILDRIGPDQGPTGTPRL